jgi:hypothetical protein
MLIVKPSWNLHLGVLNVPQLLWRTPVLESSVGIDGVHVIAGSRRVLSGTKDMRDGFPPLPGTWLAPQAAPTTTCAVLQKFPLLTATLLVLWG